MRVGLAESARSASGSSQSRQRGVTVTVSRAGREQVAIVSQRRRGWTAVTKPVQLFQSGGDTLARRARAACCSLLAVSVRGCRVTASSAVCSLATAGPCVPDELSCSSSNRRPVVSCGIRAVVAEGPPGSASWPLAPAVDAKRAAAQSFAAAASWLPTAAAGETAAPAAVLRSRPFAALPTGARHGSRRATLPAALATSGRSRSAGSAAQYASAAVRVRTGRPSDAASVPSAALCFRRPRRTSERHALPRQRSVRQPVIAPSCEPAQRHESWWDARPACSVPVPAAADAGSARSNAAAPADVPASAFRTRPDAPPAPEPEPRPAAADVQPRRKRRRRLDGPAQFRIGWSAHRRRWSAERRTGPPGLIPFLSTLHFKLRFSFPFLLDSRWCSLFPPVHD